MKQFRLVWQSLLQIKGAALLLMIVLTLALFVLTYLIGLIRYQNYSRTLLEQAEINNSVYLKLAVDDNQMAQDMYGTFSAIARTYEEIADWPGIKEIISIYSYGSMKIDGINYQMLVYNDALLRHFSMAVDGRWFPDKPVSVDQPLPIVLGGTGFSDFETGDVLTAEYSRTQKPISLNVYGKVKYPGYTLSLSNGSTIILSDYLLSDQPVILVRDEPSLLSRLDTSDQVMIDRNAWVVFENGLSEQQQGELLTRLGSYGSYHTYEDIITASRESHIEQLKEILPIPLFLFFSAFSCLFSISSLYVMRNAQNQILYFFCGCSRKRMIGILAQGLFMIFLPPALLNLLFILFYPTISQADWLNLHQVVLDGTSVSLVLLFLAVLLVFLLLPALMISRRHTPMQLYRRMSS
ncbi:hypothetical protein QWJ34_11420 [Saccharibacillus sp. CPCC 101409]|uniref:hypothetical protein n=1 Tax=Saccharibacillus sp. CPCC 101409 TaxID=3058041 RepID=UPI002670F644|nr:hypothetical protein [Saccharibacillus sp. CPCC 101409]MDO3410373.1 hypothetical protein [Saccharibacillus sp. CPCC 101409]